MNGLLKALFHRLLEATGLSIIFFEAQLLPHWGEATPKTVAQAAISFRLGQDGNLDKRCFRVLFILAGVNNFPFSWMKRGLDSSDPCFSNLRE